ncbi:MAG: glycosyltransferase [Propionibacteriaceae bacterium]|nr:glycosyltransferase [Propionibacteriaceae bacterium]
MGRFAIFVEDRVFRRSDGDVVSTNRRLEDRHWQELGPAGHEAVLCARLKPSDDEVAPHVIDGTVIGLPYYKGIAGTNALKLPLLFMKALRIAREVDLVVAKCPGLVGNLAVFAARLTGTPAAVHFVGDIVDSISSSSSARHRQLIKWLATKMSQLAVRQAAAVRYPTQAFLQSKYGAADSSRQFWYTDAAVEALDTVPTPSFVPGRIVAIGTQEVMYKGHDFLIRAMLTIREKVPGATLVLVGNGACRGQLVDLVDELDLRDCVEFVDFLDGWGEVSAVLRSAHVFAMPSLVEGLPRALLEAMSLGTACVGTEVAGIPELLPRHLLVPSGEVAPLADAITRLLTDEEARLQAANECLERSRPFTAEALEPNIEAWQDRLQELIAR